MSTTPDPTPASPASPADATTPDATTPDEAEAVAATTRAEAVEPETTEGTERTEGTEPADSAEPDEAQSAPPTAPTPSSSTSADDADADDAGGTTSDEAPSDGASDETSAEERQKSAEEFAAEHDPAKHDIAAGEEFRQPGDWTADDAGGPQVWDDQGNLVAEGGEATDAGAAAGGRRVSDLDEVRDGGYSVGSAATLHDGAMPLGHPVKAWEDTKTFVTEEHDHYDEAEPDVWFTDADAAGRAGFRPAD